MSSAQVLGSIAAAAGKASASTTPLGQVLVPAGEAIGTGVGAAIDRSHLLEHSSSEAGKAASSLTYMALGIPEKLMIGVIILICIILLVIGASLWLNGSWKSGLILSALGVGGIAGSVYWAQHPAAASFAGRGEDEISGENYEDIDDFENLSGDVDELDYINLGSINDPEAGRREKSVRFTGSHEATMLENLHKIIEILQSAEGDKRDRLDTIKNMIANKESEADKSLEDIIEMLDVSIAKRQELMDAFSKLDEVEQEEILAIVGGIKKLSERVREKSSAIEQKLDEFIAMFH